MFHEASPSRTLFLAIVPALFVPIVLAQPKATAEAGPFLVTKTADTADGACDADCSLREAIIAANATSGDITLPAGTYNLTLAGNNEDAAAKGDLDVTGGLGLAINGGGAATTIIDGGGLDRVFHIRSGTVSISAVTIRNGTGAYGAGIYNNGTLSLEDCTVSGNTATGNHGGGIYNNATLAVTGGTISGNTAGSNGGGIYNANSTTLTITNSTISGNTATGAGQGGGIYNIGPLILRSSTISRNSSGGNGAGIANGTASGSNVSLKNTILAGNIGPVTGPDCFGAMTSLGNNLIQVVTAGCVVGGDARGNITGRDASLGPLADNGGPTQTHAVLPGSPAIDAGSADGPPPSSDQRGIARPLGVACDIGAYEAPAPTPSPTPAAVPVPPPPPITSPPAPTPGSLP